jgi:hypothetical protein
LIIWNLLTRVSLLTLLLVLGCGQSYRHVTSKATRHAETLWDKETLEEIQIPKRYLVAIDHVLYQVDKIVYDDAQEGDKVSESTYRVIVARSIKMEEAYRLKVENCFDFKPARPVKTH